MKTTIYISNDSVKAVEGAVSEKGIEVTQCAKISFSQEAVINGVLIDEEEVAKALSRLKKKLRLKNCTLVIDNSQIMTKKLHAPLLSEKNLCELVENEFSAPESQGEMVYDYMVIDQGSKQTGCEILAGAVERSLIKKYVDIFAAEKIKITSIDLAVAAVIKLVSNLAGLKKSNCIVSVLDGNSVSSFVASKGIYKFYNRTRLFEERGTAAAARELTKILSSIMQFNSTDRTSEAVSDIYFCNIPKEQLVIKDSEKQDDGFDFVDAAPKKAAKTSETGLLDMLSSTLGVNVALMPDFVKLPSADRTPHTTAEYIYNIGSLLGR